MKNSSSLIAIMGEVLWHSLTIDPTIDEVSKQHFKKIKSIIDVHYEKPNAKRPIKILEIAAYAHTTGYSLASDMAAEVVLTDISVDTLALGQREAGSDLGMLPTVKRVAADFHDLPFVDGQFDIVYISSALHHTWDWQEVLNEMVRVLASGGLLYIENEPCLREFCFYRFRTNRPDQFRPFEKTLKQLEIIHTIAEPYLGSRPEELFGMVENQTIPLDELFSVLLMSGDIKEKVLLPELCMDGFENEVINMRSKGENAVRLFISDTLKSGVKKAAAYLEKNDIALGYGIPDSVEIDSMAEQISKKVLALDVDESTEEFREGISKLFGASVTVLLQKRGELPDRLPSFDLLYDWGKRNDVMISYPDTVEAVLNRIKDVLPNIQSASEAKLREVYPSADWSIAVSENGIRTLTPVVNGGRILCNAVPNAKVLQVLIRVYVHYEDIPYRLHLSLDGKELDVYEVYQIDSFLFCVEIRDVPSQNFELVLSMTLIDSEVSTFRCPPVNISGARLCAIQ